MISKDIFNEDTPIADTNYENQKAAERYTLQLFLI